MRVAVLTTVYPRWADDFFGNYIHHHAEAHTANGAEVRVVAPHTAGALLREELGGVRVDRFRYGLPASIQTIAYGGGVLTQLDSRLLAKLLLPIFVLSFFVRSIGAVRWAQIVHVHWTLAGLIGISLARLLRRRSVLTVYGIEVFTGRFRFFTRLCLRWADHVICISTATEGKLRQEFGSEVAKASSVIPFGVKEALLAQDEHEIVMREQHGIAPGSMIVLSVGRLIERKGTEYLVRAASSLASRGDVHFVIVGEGPERARLERLTAGLGVRDHVTFAGAVPNAQLAAYYRQCDIFAHPVVTDATGDVEGLGIVILEAMACSKPTVASGIGGITDVVVDDETGLLVPEKDADALAARLSTLLDSRELRERMGLAGKRRAHEHFSASDRAGEVMQVYERLLAQRAS